MYPFPLAQSCCLVAKSYLTVCGPVDGSPSGSSVHGISQARILKWVAILYCRRSPRSRDQTCVSCIGKWILYPCATWKALFFQFSSVQSLSHVRLFETPWTAACQASLSITNSGSPPKPMSIESVMPSNHLVLCCPLLLLPFNLPQHQGLFQWINSLHQMAKVLEFQLQHQSFQWVFRTDIL